jgi:phasin family protein
MLRCIYDAAEARWTGGDIPKKTGSNTMINGFEDIQKVGRENINRTLETFGALSRGWQTLANETAGYSKQALEDGTAHVEKLMGVKSLDVAFETQANFARTTYERAVGQAARFGELYVDLVREAVKPFEDAVSAAKK